LERRIVARMNTTTDALRALLPLALLLAACPPASAQPAVPPATLAVIGGTLVDAASPGPRRIADAVVIVRGTRITCAGTRSQCPVPGGATIIDARGAFVAPGIIDAHVHFSQTGWVDGRPDAFDARREFPYDSTIAALRAHPEVFGRTQLCAGVTSVFDVGGYPWTIPMAQSTVERTDMPRVVAAGPLLSTIDHWVNLPDMRQFVHMSTDSLVRAAVREQRYMGARALKVWYIAQTDTALKRRGRALLAAAGEEAKRVGLPLIVHATDLAEAKEALAAGAKVLVHSVDDAELDDEFVRLARANHTILIPTLTVLEGYADVLLGREVSARYPLDCVDAATRAKLSRRLAANERVTAYFAGPGPKKERATMEANLRRLLREGIPIAMGTDAGNPGTAHGPSVYRELEALQAAGMPAPAVFGATTLNGAIAMGIDRDAGTLEAGKRADLVVLDADPTADAANWRRLRLVVRNGRAYRRAELLPR
jgi:imidazolonepropionase-like amidohydrolase